MTPNQIVSIRATSSTSEFNSLELQGTCAVIMFSITNAFSTVLNTMMVNAIIAFSTFRSFLLDSFWLRSIINSSSTTSTTILLSKFTY